MKSFILLLAVASICLLSCAQKPNLINGEWKEVRKTLRDGETGRNVTIDGKDYVPAWKLKFSSDGICHDLENDLDNSFTLEGDLLAVGYDQFKVTKLTSTELVLVEFDENDPEDPLAFIHEFKKIE